MMDRAPEATVETLMFSLRRGVDELWPADDYPYLTRKRSRGRQS